MFFLILQSVENIEGQEPKLATFQETAQLIIDKQISNNVTAAISLQTSSNQEIRIPTELVNKIQNSNRILAVIVTNQPQCVLGVTADDACVMINFSGQNITGGITGIQDIGRVIGDSLITDIEDALRIKVDFHSVYVHHRDASNVALETSGVISGKGTVSAVYTMPKEDTDSMYEKLSAILLPKVIRDANGFIKVAQDLATDKNASMTLSIIPQDRLTLFQLQLSVDYPNSASTIDKVSPLEFFKIDKLERSNYFSEDFYPLNSLLKVVILSPDPLQISSVNTNIVPTVIIDGERLPEFSQDGWFFDQKSGKKIEATYLFGKKFSVNKNDLIFTVTSAGETVLIDDEIKPEATDLDSYQIVVLVGIIMAAIGAVIYYLKGFKAKS